MENTTYDNLLKHSFWGNFDSGVLFIFLSFYIWNKTENMFTIAIAFMIPIVINTVIDFYFSNLSDKSDRMKLMIIGNIGSAIFLSLYSLGENIYLLYLLIFLKSFCAKIYHSSLAPFEREVIEEDKYKEFIALETKRVSIGASIGGFFLMYLYMYTGSIPLVFIISGLIELYSTIYLIRIKDTKKIKRERKEKDIDLKSIKDITLIYTIHAFGIALIINRMIIFLHDTRSVKIQDVGLIFFIVYGISNIVAANIYHKFEKISLKNMFVLVFISQSMLLILFTQINELNIIIGIWFLYQLVSNITNIYSSDRINKSLFTDIGKRLSRFRISIAIGSIFGQIAVSQIWERIGVGESFYFSSVVLIVLAIFIGLKRNVILQEEVEYISD